MKKFFLTFGLLFLWTQAPGQSAVDSASTQAEHVRIEVQRKQELARYDQQEQACAGKFFVNNCLAAVKTQRRETLAELKRQEISLNDSEHRRKAAQQLEQTQRKSGETAASASESSGLKEQAADRLRRKTQEKAQAQMQSDASAQARAQEQKKKKRVEPDAATAAQADAAAKNQRLYLQKRADAAQHKAGLLQRQKEKTKPQALPLPDPP